MRQMRRTGPRQSKAVVGARATSDFVHEDEAVRRCVVEDVCGFCHLDHECGAPAREIVRGANSGENLVDRTEYGFTCRYERSNVGEHGNQRHLTHVRGLPSHIRAGNDEHPPLTGEP